MENSYVLGLDLSLSSTGISVFTNDGNFVTCKTIETNAKEETRLRLKYIGEELIKIRDEFNPTVVIIEEGFTLFNKSTQAIFRVHGIANYIFCDTPQIYYAATAVKKAITGKGNSKKEEVQRCILLSDNSLRFRNMDESDSYAVAVTYFKNKKE